MGFTRFRRHISTLNNRYFATGCYWLKTTFDDKAELKEFEQTALKLTLTAVCLRIAISNF